MELKGVGVSPGIAVGAALVIERERVPVFRLMIAPAGVAAEVARLEQAVRVSRAQLQSIKQRLARAASLPHAYIFEAQTLMLDDPLLVPRAIAVIREEHVNAEWAVRSVGERLQQQFDEFTDAYLRERRSDVFDVLGRIQLNLSGEGAPSLSRLPGSFVLVAADLAPSEAAELDWERVLAVALDAGSPTYHTSILARSFGVPAVVGLAQATRCVPAGALVVVDGSSGRLVIEPSGPMLAGFRSSQQRERQENEERLESTRSLAAVTLDGVTVRLRANAELPEEAATSLLYGAEGIGLFRSEYLLGRHRHWPSEEKQLEVYLRLQEQVRPFPVTVRTWDLGPEDLMPGGPSSANPALGPRALRLAQGNAQPFQVQLRALLRAAASGPLRIMLPFIGGTADLEVALAMVEECRVALRHEGLRFRADTPIGVALEVPSAALTADLLAPRVDFFSIGTNDLIQYLLAVDRVDPRVAPLYQPLHPAVLRVIRGVVLAAEQHQRPLSLCGEMAANPLQCLALLGLGIRELSLAPLSIPRIKQTLRAARADAAAASVLRCLELPDAASVQARLQADLGAALQQLPQPQAKE